MTGSEELVSTLRDFPTDYVSSTIQPHHQMYYTTHNRTSDSIQYVHTVCTVYISIKVIKRNQEYDSLSPLRIVDYIGHGNFADIHKATWSKPKQDEECYVATKTLVSKAPKDKVRFLQEAHIMSQFNHNNIVKIYGVLAEKKPVSVKQCNNVLCGCAVILCA